jgi:hypothetical protein
MGPGERRVAPVEYPYPEDQGYGLFTQRRGSMEFSEGAPLTDALPTRRQTGVFSKG